MELMQQPDNYKLAVIHLFAKYDYSKITIRSVWSYQIPAASQIMPVIWHYHKHMYWNEGNF